MYNIKPIKNRKPTPKNVKTLVNPVNLVGIVVSLVWTITSYKQA